MMTSLVLLLFALMTPAQARPGAPAPALAMSLDVDASDAPMKILHATATMPAHAGAMTLFYPKWIPGEHMPSGPIANLTGLHVFADGTELEWRRDLVEMNAFAITVPAGASSLTAKYDYVVPTGGGAFGSTASTNAKIAVINWYTVGLYPMGESPAAITVTATLKAPAGWKHGGSLDVDRVIDGPGGDTIHYAPTSLEMLNDHPVLLGEHFRSITLWPAGSAPGEHVLDVVADSEWALQFPPARIEAYKKIVLEERRVFGDVGHYRKYHWLLTLSDNLGSFGVEHHECADDRVAENTFVDDDTAKRSSLLLPHEFFHSWNGKARRPAGLVTGGYEKPMKDELLWVYEGLTNYYGELLAARGGLISAQDWIEELAADALSVAGPGRTWRPLQDTADASPYLYVAGGGWGGWRRSTDFYAEGSLIWLEADVTIRRLTQRQEDARRFLRAVSRPGGQRPRLGQGLHREGRVRRPQRSRAVRLEDVLRDAAAQEIDRPAARRRRRRRLPTRLHRCAEHVHRSLVARRRPQRLRFARYSRRRRTAPSTTPGRVRPPTPPACRTACGSSP